ARRRSICSPTATARPPSTSTRKTASTTTPGSWRNTGHVTNAATWPCATSAETKNAPAFAGALRFQTCGGSVDLRQRLALAVGRRAGQRPLERGRAFAPGIGLRLLAGDPRPD